MRGFCSSLQNLFAEETFNILVLNSDAAVTKYQIAQEEFQKTITFPVKAIDLGNKKMESSTVEELLYDENPDLVYCLGTKAYLIANICEKRTDCVFLNYQLAPPPSQRKNLWRVKKMSYILGWNSCCFTIFFRMCKKSECSIVKNIQKNGLNRPEKMQKEMGIDLIGSKCLKRSR